MIYEDRIFEIVKYPGNISGKYIIQRKQSNGFYVKAEVPANKVIKQPILVAE